MKNHEIKFPSKNTVIKIPLGGVDDSSKFIKKLSETELNFMNPNDHDYEFIIIRMEDNIGLSEEQWSKFTKLLYKNCSCFTFKFNK